MIAWARPEDQAPRTKDDQGPRTTKDQGRTRDQGLRTKDYQPSVALGSSDGHYPSPEPVGFQKINRKPSCAVRGSSVTVGIVCMMANWLRFPLGRLSMSEFEMLVPIGLTVVSTRGSWPVTAPVPPHRQVAASGSR